MDGDRDDLEMPRLGKAPAERAAAAVLPVSGLVWTAAEAMHLVGVHASLPIGGTAAFAALASWGLAGRRDDFPQSLPWWVAVTGGWLAVADAVGPLHWWPAPVLSIAWAAIAFTASKAAHRHEAVIEAREWRAARADWLRRSHDWHLGGSHLLDFERTRLGERYTVSTRGTGKRASQIAGSGIAEVIAEQENLPVSRVQVVKHRLAGRIVISVRRVDPWAEPIRHPVLCENPETVLPVPCSITVPAQIGADPETGRLLTVPLHDETGGKNVNVVAIRGGGKTVVLDDLSERVTAASDALMVRINLSVKGHAEAERWGPACHLTAFGPQAGSRAVRVLKAVNGVIEWRSKRYTTTKYVPSPEDPAMVAFIDEGDSAMAFPAVRKEVDDIATKGREYGVTLVRAGQRGTTDYGSAKTRSQDDVFLVGKVNRQGEAYHAAGNAGFSLPDMAGYGEGHAGVWAVAELGSPHMTGRAFLMEPAEVAAIAAERAFTQPELPAACREFLGTPYEALLASEVFARWARARSGEVPEDTEEPGEPGSSPAVTVQADSGDGAEPEAVTVTAAVATAEEDPLRGLDWEMDVDDDTRSRLAALDAKNENTRRMLAETRSMPAPPQVSAEALAAHTAARWRQVAEEPPRELFGPLLEMLEEGTTIPAVEKRFGVRKWQARKWLEYFRFTGATYVDGERKAARWRLAPPLPEVDAQ